MVNNFRKNQSFEFFRKRKSAYINAKIVNETCRAVVVCKQCGQKLRVPVSGNKILLITCPKCKHSFQFNCQRYEQSKKILAGAMYGVLLVVLAVDLAAPIYFYPKISSFNSKLNNKYEEEFKQMKLRFSKEMQDLKTQNAAIIDNINPKDLRIKAEEQYAKIWDERKNYDKKYAITTREKVQMEMLALASDSTKEINKIVSEIAAKVAPKNSEINSYTTNYGVLLNVDFNMSDVTRGEKGTSTKHSTIDSLKGETLRLISKVSNDVYNFCRDLDLETITIGCKHEVTTSYPDGTNAGKEGLIIYKVRLDKQNIKELKHNPFLDTYSVTQYLNVIEDKFSTLHIVNQ